MIDNKYGIKKRFLIWLHEISPAFQVTKRFSLAFKKRRLLRRLRDAQAKDDSGLAPLFQSIEIETINRCNGGCRFCPVNRVDNPRPFMKMPTELFSKIISDLKAIDYQGKVCLYSNNEPFLDERLFDFAASAREALPKAFIEISTNGLVLTHEKYMRIIGLINRIVINDYRNDLKISPHVLDIQKKIESTPELDRKTCINVRYVNEVMTSRGGQAPNAKTVNRKTLPFGCFRPTEQMIVRPDGKLSLCCCDALGTVTLGDVAKDDILTVWNSETARDARRKTLQSREYFDICKSCDVFQ